MTTNSHHKIRQMLKGRIESGEWELGALIPRELALAEEYNCARTTINRALQALADEGVVVRKRKGGTRVCRMPVRHAKFGISILREQVEVTGSKYRHQNVVTKLKVPPKSVRAKLQTSESQEALFLQTIHLADNSPYAYEERWVNVATSSSVTMTNLVYINWRRKDHTPIITRLAWPGYCFFHTDHSHTIRAAFGG